MQLVYIKHVFVTCIRKSFSVFPFTDAQSPPYIREGNSTTINTVAIAYDFTSSGSADYYIITINSNPVQNRNISQISGTDQFDNLIPGEIYVIAAYSVTQGLYSSGPIATASIGTCKLEVCTRRI